MVPIEKRPEIDRWVMSLLNSLVKEVTDAYETYEPTKAARAIQNFVGENLSNWYVRLNRKRFWGGSFTDDKLAAYQTLHSCLEAVALLGAPIAPFFMDRLFCDLNKMSKRFNEASVHLAAMPGVTESAIDTQLEERMQYAQDISSMVLALRRKVAIKVRQPLQKMMIPILDQEFQVQLERVKDLVLAEVNVKDIEFLKDSAGILVKKIKPNFKTLGPKYGKLMKSISEAVGQMGQHDIAELERNGFFALQIQGEAVELGLEHVEITSEDIPGWLVASEGKITVALDVNVTPELREEGIAREFINRIQNIRKDSGFDVTDKVNIKIQRHDSINTAIEKHRDYIAAQTLAVNILLMDSCDDSAAKSVDIDEEIITFISVSLAQN
nr:anticodon-binding domain of tRNA [uncultured bacterium]